MKITHLSSNDLEGGAARAAYRLHRGLCALGQDSRFVTLWKKSADPTVKQFDPPSDLPTRLRRVVKRQILGLSAGKMGLRPRGASLFSSDQSQHEADVLRATSGADILNLHWVVGCFDYRKFFRAVPAGTPLVWTLHDMNPFTGGCHFDEHCGKYAEKCGACPQLGSSDTKDLSWRIWERKRMAFLPLGAERLRLVAPSRWMADEVKKSALLGDRPVEVIPNGVDTGVFQPRDRGVAREKLGLPKDAKVVLFVADAAAEKRKGLAVLVEALRELQSSGEIFFAAIGRGLAEQELGGRCHVIGYEDDETAMSFVYSAADVFVAPSLQDNLPNTLIEALACGVPAAGSDAGGIPEIVRQRKTGLLAKPSDAQDLRRAIVELLGDSERLRRMAGDCRRIACEEYSLEIQARRYERLYREMVERSKAGS